jgi:DNA-binding transcriptional MerR regulator
MTEQKFTLKEMCTKFDVTPRTLRYYEYIELLTPEKVGRSRLYAARELARLKLILRGRRFGFSLEEIRQWLEMYQGHSDNTPQMERWVEMATDQIAELETRKEHLQEAIDELSALRRTTLDNMPK